MKRRSEKTSVPQKTQGELRWLSPSIRKIGVFKGERDLVVLFHISFSQITSEPLFEIYKTIFLVN